MAFGDITIRVEGLEQAERKARRVLSTLDSKDVEKVMLNGAKIIKKAARRNASKGPTGNLRRALKAKKSKNRQAFIKTAFAAVDRRIAPHAWLVEHGGHGIRRPKKASILYDSKSGKAFGASVAAMPAKPYLRPAINSELANVERTVNTGIARLIGRAVK